MPPAIFSQSYHGLVEFLGSISSKLNQLPLNDDLLRRVDHILTDRARNSPQKQIKLMLDSKSCSILLGGIVCPFFSPRIEGSLFFFKAVPRLKRFFVEMFFTTFCYACWKRNIGIYSFHGFATTFWGDPASFFHLAQKNKGINTWLRENFPTSIVHFQALELNKESGTVFGAAGLSW